VTVTARVRVRVRVRVKVRVRVRVRVRARARARARVRDSTGARVGARRVGRATERCRRAVVELRVEEIVHLRN
jgi:hypothetical protein